MVSVSLAEAVVQQTAIIEEARSQMLRAEQPSTHTFWADIQLKAIAAIDALCLRRMNASTYEALRRQQQALMAGLRVPEQTRG